MLRKVIVRGWDPIKRLLTKATPWKEHDVQKSVQWEPHKAPTSRHRSGTGYWDIKRAKAWMVNNRFVVLGGVLVAAVVVVVLVAATGGGKGGGQPSVLSLQCGAGESLVVLQAGQNDNYAGAADVPAASPSSGLSTRLTTTPPLTGFDATAVDRRFAHTFTGLPPAITQAELETRLKPRQTSIHPASENDTIDLSFTASSGALQPGGWSRYIGSGNSAAGLVSTQWLPSHWASGSVFTWSLANLPTASGPAINHIASLNSLGYLDVIVQDDTSVDYLTLRLCVPATPTPTPTLAPTRIPIAGSPIVLPTSAPTATQQPQPTLSAGTAIPVATATNTPTATVTATPTATCGPAGALGSCTPTVGPSATPSATPRPTATFTATPKPCEPNCTE